MAINMSDEQWAAIAACALGKLFAEIEISNGAVLDIEAQGGYSTQFVVDRLDSLDDLKELVLQNMLKEIAAQKQSNPEYFQE